MKNSKTSRRILAVTLAATMALTSAWGASAAVADSGPSVIAPVAEANQMDRYIQYGEMEIDAFTGALHLTEEFSFGQSNRDVPFGLYYDSQESGNFGFGTGMRSLYNASLEKISDDAYLYHDYTGKSFTFEKDPVTGAYTDVLGRALEMEDADWIALKPLGGNYPSLAFSRETGRLVSYVVGNGIPTINMYYNDEGLLVNAVASTGMKYLTFTYEDGPNGAKLCSSVMFTSNIGTNGYSLSYDEQGRFTGYRYVGDSSGSELYQMEYGEDGLVQNVNDQGGNRIAFTYQTIDGVKRLTYAAFYQAGSSGPNTTYQLAYGKDQTIVIDQNGLMRTIRFDANGNVIA